MKVLAFLIAILGITISPLSQAEALSAAIDRYKIGEDETITLTVTYDDASVSGQPDLGGLGSIFEIINSSSSSETRMINGSFSSTKKWRYTLIPKKTGKFFIPSLSLKNSYSEPIEIEVIDSASLRSIQENNRGDLFIEATVDKKEVYVEEKITLTLRIYTSVQIAQPKLPTLNLPGFMVEKIAENQFETRMGDRNYYVLEYQYAVFAHQSGDLNIPKQRYQIAQIISNGPRSLFDIRDIASQTQARFLSTTEIPLHIKAMPTNNPVDYWLASDDVTLTDNWQDEQSTEIGTPVTRIIEIKALGNLAVNIPPLPGQMLNGLKNYSEQPVLTNARAGENLLATRKESMAIVAVTPGRYTLPEVELHWWSNKEKRFRISTLPQRTLIVNATSLNTDSAISLNSSNNDTSATPETQTPVEKKPDAIPTANAPFYLNVYIWMAITATLLCILLIIIIGLFVYKNKTQSKNTESIKNIGFKQNFRELEQACAANDARKARSALISYAQQKWPADSLCTLREIKLKIDSPVFNALANDLDATLYGDTVIWNGQAMLNFIKSTDFIDSSRKSLLKSQEIVLPDLYP